jgi:hypothetical protein
MGNIGAKAARWAGLQIDLNQKYRSGHITADHLDWFNNLSKDSRDGFLVGEKPAMKSVVIVSENGPNFWLDKCQEFTKKYFGMEIDLRKRFAIPAELPWNSIIPVFDPGGITNRDAIKILKKLKLTIWEEVDVMDYSGSEAKNGPSLHFIQNSVRPDEDTLGNQCMSPDQLVATNKNWLNLRGYALAFGLYYFITQEYLDPQTFTWFPNNRLASGRVAGGLWLPDNCKVRFRWGNPGSRYGGRGARLAMPVSLLP